MEYSFDPDDFDRRDFYDERRDIDRERRMDDARRDLERDRDRDQERIELLQLDRERDAVMEVVNNPNITMDSSMLRAINDPNVRMRSGRDAIRRSGQFSRSSLLFGIGLGLGDKDKKRTRKKTKTDKNMSKALAQANSELRTKNGKLRKGKTQADVMRRAHRIRRKMP